MPLLQEMDLLDAKIKERNRQDNARIEAILAARPELKTIKSEIASLRMAIARYEASIQTDKRKIRSCRYSDTSILANAITQNTIKIKVAKQKLEALESTWIKELNLYPN